MKFGVLTVSDSCSVNQAIDKSGQGVKSFLEEQTKFLHSCEVEYNVVPDVKESIKNNLERWIDNNVDVILTVGGTGCSERDVTPEATREIIDKEVLGLSIAMLINSLQFVPSAMLSRSVCGIKNKTLIINLPGSPKGSLECLKVIFPVLGHAIDLIQNNKDVIKNTHEKIHLKEHHSGHGDIVSLPCSVEFLSHVHQDHQRVPSSCPQHHHMDFQHIHNQYRHCHRQRYLSLASQQRVPDSEQSIVNEDMVAMRMRQSSFPILNVEDALEIVLQESFTFGVESLPYDQCLHRIVAADVFSESCLPPFNASIKDGYAVVAGDGGGLRKVIGGISAGSMLQAPLKNGHCYRISTGAPIPFGADSVVQVEDTKLVKSSDDGMEELEIEILVPPKFGQDIRPSGCDIGLRDCILKRGMKIGPAEIGLMASAGNMSISCFKSPLIAVLSTGNEVVEPEIELVDGCIRDCNRPMLMSALKENGFSAVDLGIVIDKATALKSCFKAAFDSVDIVVSTGGVSMGEKDLVKRVLAEDFNAKIHFERIFMKPGKPTTFATLQIKDKKKYFFCLPGNPVSALVTFYLFVLPALRYMSGDPHCKPHSIKARLAEPQKLDERPEYHRCILKWSDADSLPVALSTGNQLSSKLLSMSSAQGLLKLPPSSQSCHILEKGCIVDCIMLNKI